MVNKTRLSDDLGELKMPNMCQNILYITGKKEDLEDFASKSEDGKFTLSTYHPFDEKSDWDYGIWCAEHWGTKWDVTTEIDAVMVAENSPEHPTDVSKTTELVIKPEREDSWGDTIGPEIELSFDTPWGSPIKAITKIAKDYPKLNFSIYYFEAGHWFAGVSKFKNGREVYSIEYHGEQLTLETA